MDECVKKDWVNFVEMEGVTLICVSVLVCPDTPVAILYITLMNGLLIVRPGSLPGYLDYVMIIMMDE